MSIEIGHVVGEFADDDRSDLMAYVEVAATLDHQPITLGAMVGARPDQHGTVRAAGGWVRPFVSTWWEDASDWQAVPEDRREEAEDALSEVALRLWDEVIALRAGRPRSR